MTTTRAHSTTCELDLRVEYENGPEGPEIVAIFVGEVSRKQRALILAETRAIETQIDEAARLEDALGRSWEPKGEV